MKAAARLIVAAALAAAFPAHASTGSLAGEEIVKAKCASCHEKGEKGAPRIGDRDAWIPKVKKGLDATVRAAIRGHGAMPARGGMAEVTDEEFRSAVIYLLNPSYPLPRPAAAPPLGHNQRVVDGTEIFLGVKPVKDGVYKLSVSLRDAATRAVIEDAQVEVNVSNPVMGADARKLNKETVEKAVSYGNEFRIRGREPHVITVEIRRPGNPKLIQAKFDFRG